MVSAKLMFTSQLESNFHLPTMQGRDRRQVDGGATGGTTTTTTAAAAAAAAAAEVAPVEPLHEKEQYAQRHEAEGPILRDAPLQLQHLEPAGVGLRTDGRRM